MSSTGFSCLYDCDLRMYLTDSFVEYTPEKKHETSVEYIHINSEKHAKTDFFNLTK